MTIKRVRKFGFFVSIAMLLGIVVGVGIFFKNNSIARAVNHNGIS
jgi:hypothetical protein